MTSPDKSTGPLHGQLPSQLPGRLARLNVTGVFLATIGFMLVALFAPGIVGAALLLVLAGALIGLMAMTWPVTPPRTRALRLVLVALLVAIALVKIF